MAMIDRSLDAFSAQARARMAAAESNEYRPRKVPATPQPEPRALSVEPMGPVTSHITAATYGPTQTRPTGVEKRGTTEWENRTHAIGLANVGRTNVETLNFAVGNYNSLKNDLDDPALHEQYKRMAAIRSEYLGEDPDAFYNGMIGALESGMDMSLKLIKNATSNMHMNFNVSGRPVSQDATGAYRVNAYTQSASGPDWSVNVTSIGRATVVANGIDLSGEIDSSRADGFRWTDISVAAGQTIDIAA